MAALGAAVGLLQGGHHGPQVTEQRTKEYSERRCGLPKGTLLVGGRAGLIIPTTPVVPRMRESGGGSRLCARRFGKVGGRAGAAAGSVPKNHPAPLPTPGLLYSQAPLVTLSLSPLSISQSASPHCLLASLHWRCRVWAPQGAVPTSCMDSGQVTSQGHTYSLKSFLLELKDPDFLRVFSLPGARR